MSSLLKKIPDIAVALIIMGLLIPIGMTFYTNANTTGWDTQTLQIWDAIPVFAILSIGMAVIFGAIVITKGRSRK